MQHYSGKRHKMSLGFFFSVKGGNYTLFSLCLSKDIYRYLRKVGVVRTDWLLLIGTLERDGEQHQLA